MSVLERPGIHPNWLALWAQDYAFFANIFNQGEDKSIRELENFVLCGDTLSISPIPQRPGDPAVAKWEDGFLTIFLDTYADRQLIKFEMQSIDNNVWEATSASQVFSTMYTEQLVSLGWHAHFPLLNKGRV